MRKSILRYIGTWLIERDTPRSFPNLIGDRDIEWSFVAAHLPNGPGQALDFGTGGSSLGLIAARKSYRVTSIDLRRINLHYEYPNLEFIEGDLLEMAFPDHHFDVIINCSTIEHVGLAGRYGILFDKPDADIQAMGILKQMMKPSGTMILTLPVGQDAVFPSLHRVYGMERLPILLDGFSIEYEEFWVKDSRNTWILSNKTETLAGQPQRDLYGIGCFVLRKN